MRQGLKGATLALLIMSASACNSRPERVVVQHPPAADLFGTRLPDGSWKPACPAEPAVPAADAGEAAFLNFDGLVLLAGRECRAAHARVCQWHVDRGMDPPDGIRCEP